MVYRASIICYIGRSILARRTDIRLTSDLRKHVFRYDDRNFAPQFRVALEVAAKPRWLYAISISYLTDPR